MRKIEGIRVHGLYIQSDPLRSGCTVDIVRCTTDIPIGKVGYKGMSSAINQYSDVIKFTTFLCSR